MNLDFLPIPIWMIVVLAIIIVIPTYVMITGRNAGGGFRGRRGRRRTGDRGGRCRRRTISAPWGLPPT